MLTLFRSEHCYPYEVNEKKKTKRMRRVVLEWFSRECVHRTGVHAWNGGKIVLACVPHIQHIKVRILII